MTEVVGVDLGGTKVAVAHLRDGRLGDSLVEPTNRSSATALIDQLDELGLVRRELRARVSVGEAARARPIGAGAEEQRRGGRDV